MKILIIIIFLFWLFSCWEKTVDDCENQECIDLIISKNNAKKDLDKAKMEAKKYILKNTWIKNEIKEKNIKSDFKITSYSCNDDDLKECGNSMNEVIINNVLKVNDVVCDLNWKIEPDQYQNIFDDFDKRLDTVSDLKIIENDWIKELSFILTKNNTKTNIKWKNVNIMFDLTYFSGNKDTEKDVFENRKKVLKEIISKWNNYTKIEYWDKINLFYIGTSDYWENSKWHKNYAITDTEHFILKNQWSNLSWTYSIKYICEKNSRKKTLKFYYKSEWRKDLELVKQKFNNIFVSNIGLLEKELIKKVETKYNEWKYNRWTYLIESLDKNEQFINGKEDVNFLISDMFFQIHPEMKKNYNIKWPEYDFTQDYILKLWKYIDYTSFYDKITSKYLNNKCNNKEELYIYWTNLSDNLDLKEKLKEFYKNKFFKWCNVHFN